jgi:NAD+ kinase
MLRAMRLADRQRAPVLGVNLGKLGFLAEVDVPDLPGALSAIDSKQFTIEPRLAIDGALGAKGLGRSGLPVQTRNGPAAGPAAAAGLRTV